jgi:methyl-accepting chemotaxis protein
VWLRLNSLLLILSGSFTVLFLVLLILRQKKNKKNTALFKRSLEEKEQRIRELSASLGEAALAGTKTFGPEETDTGEPRDLDSLESLVENINSILQSAMDRERAADSAENSQGAFEDLLKSNENIRENTNKAFDISDNLSGSAKAAFEISEKVQNGIQTITSALSDTLNFSELLYKQSGQISNITEILSDISEKINLLSFNASIVSARAGIHGKAFEVVAREVRKLGLETNSSLSKIEEEIRSIQRVISELVTKIRSAAAETEEEKASLISVVGTLRGITLGVEVFRAVSKIANEKASLQQELIDTIKHYCERSLQRTGVLESVYSKTRQEITTLNKELTRMVHPHVSTGEE